MTPRRGKPRPPASESKPRPEKAGLIMITWLLEQTRCEDCVRMIGEPDDGDDDEDDG